MLGGSSQDLDTQLDSHPYLEAINFGHWEGESCPRSWGLRTAMVLLRIAGVK